MSLKRSSSHLLQNNPHPQKSQRHHHTQTHPPLSSLLDFSHLSSQADIYSRFTQLSQSLLNHHTLLLLRQGLEIEYDILEIEFYLLKEGCHEDPYTHGAEEQRSSGRWYVPLALFSSFLHDLYYILRYFHRAPGTRSTSESPTTAAGGYRGGTRKGLDLTIAGPITSPYFSTPTSPPPPLLRGGILLRTIQRKSDSTVISGPSLLVDEILKSHNVRNISELVHSVWAGDTLALPSTTTTTTSSSCTLSLRPKSATTAAGTATVYTSPRIGLDLSHPSVKNTKTDPRIIFLAKRYRHFVHPHLLTSNGKAHTFLGVFQTCKESSSSSDRHALEETIKLTGLKPQTALKYFTEYSDALQNSKSGLDPFIGPSGKGASASPSTYLKMMGALVKSLEIADK